MSLFEKNTMKRKNILGRRVGYFILVFSLLNPLGSENKLDWKVNIKGRERRKNMRNAKLTKCFILFEKYCTFPPLKTGS